MKKRYKLIIMFFISFIFVFILYKLIYKDKYLYLAIGDNLNYNNITYSYIDIINNKYKHNKNYNFIHYNNFNTNNFIKDLDNNTNNINYYLKNANLITICLNVEELYNIKEINNDIIIDYLNNIYMILNRIRKLNNNKIILIDPYNDKYEFISKKIKLYSDNNNITNIKLKNDIYIINNKSYIPYQSHLRISNTIESLY